MNLEKQQDHYPVYIKTHESGALRDKVRKAWKGLSSCTLCPRACRVDRTQHELGVCKTGQQAVVASYTPHFGEEAPLVGTHGSGTIFFSHCNLLCRFCQNYEISHQGEGRKISADQLAFIMLELQRQGCHNINLVTPSHVVPQILKALEIAIPQGLRIPLVYNTGAYDAVATLQLLSNVVDIYMPDFKFIRSEVAALAGVPADYPEVAKQAILEMHGQVGNLEVDESGIARHGLLVRHLVLPDKMAGTEEMMSFLAEKISPRTCINIMSQYRPCGAIGPTGAFSRTITAAEYRNAIAIAVEKGLCRDNFF